MEEQKNNDILEVEVSYSIGEITSNLQVLKEQINVELDKYRNLVVTEDEIAKAKVDKAHLSKLAKRLNDEKIRIKKIYNEPVAKFEAQVKEILASINDVTNSIDSQIKVFDNKEQEKKKQEIVEYYNMLSIDNIPIEKIWNEKWLNKTTTMKAIRETLDAFKEKVNSDIYAIQVTFNDVDAIADVLGIYYETLDVSVSIAQYREIVARNIRMQEEAKKQREQFKDDLVAVGVENVNVQVERVDVDVDSIQPVGSVQEPTPTTPNTRRVVLEFLGTTEQLQQLAGFVKMMGIQYKRIG